MLTQQLSIFIENTKGRLAEITGLLGEGGINMCALSIADTTNFGILRIIADQPKKAVDLLKSHQVRVSITEVISVGISDTPGGLAAAVRLLADNDVSVEYMYAYVGKTEQAYVVMRVDDNEKAVSLLKANGYKGPEE